MAINFLNTVAVDENVLFVDTVNDQVGIGTNSPISKLEISQQLSAASTIDYPYTISSRDDGNSINQAGGEGVGIKFRIAGNAGTTPGDSLVGASIAAIREMHGDTDSSTGLGFFISQNNEILDEAVRIDHDGKVGIGTTSPSYTLQVGDGTEDSTFSTFYSDGSRVQIHGYGLYMSRVSSYIRPVTTTTQTLYVGHTSNIWNAISNNANTHYFTTGANEHMRIKSSGNVGIGTTLPGDKLHVSGGAIRLDNFYQLRWGGTGTGVYGNSTQGLNFFTDSGSTRLKIENGGNVGINTPTPSERLDVNGNIKIKDALLSNQENTDIDSAAAEVVAQVAIATYTAAFFDFVVKKGTNLRAGTVYACHDGTNVEFTETSTNDLGDTSDVTLSVDVSGTNMRLLATVTSDDWSVKSLIRAI